MRLLWGTTLKATSSFRCWSGLLLLLLLSAEHAEAQTFPEPVPPPAPSAEASIPPPAPSPASGQPAAPAPASAAVTYPVPVSTPPAPATAPAPAAAAAATTAAAGEVNAAPAEETTKPQRSIGVELVLALPKDTIAELVRSSPGLRVHAYLPLRERLGLAAVADYVRGLNQSAVSSMAATDAYGVAGGMRLVVSQSSNHSVYAEGMVGFRHLAVDPGQGDSISGNGVGLQFAFGAEVAINAGWRATATLAYTSTGIEVKNMDSEATTMGVDFVVLGMGASTSF